MKKLIIAVLFLSTALLAEAGPFVGMGGGVLNETFSSPTLEKETQAGFVKAKIGYGNPAGYGVEVCMSYFEYDQNVFSDNDGTNLYFDVNIIKAYDFDIGFYPYLKAGIGAGYLSVGRSTDSALGNGSFQGGGGLYIPLGKGVDIEIELLYRHKNWEQVDLISEQVDVSSSVLEPYMGLNYRF